MSFNTSCPDFVDLWSTKDLDRKASEIKKALTKKGMIQDNNHHAMFRKYVDGVAHIVTRISWGRGMVVDTNLGSLMARQCMVSNHEFWQLVDCPMSEAQWDAKIRAAVAAETAVPPKLARARSKPAKLRTVKTRGPKRGR